MRHPVLRARAFLYRVRWLALFVLLWFTCAAAGFRWLAKLPVREALLCAFYVVVRPDPASQAYVQWGGWLIFGLVLTVLVRETLENYAERCRTMSQLVSAHTIIVGYSHVGKRLVDYCIAEKLPYVLIEKDREIVDDLLRKGEPVVVDDARTPDALPAANVAGAQRLVLASNNLETALIVTKRARDANKELKISARTNLDEFAEILEKLGADYVYSTSMAGLHELVSRLR